MPQNIYSITKRSYREPTEIMPGFPGAYGPHTPNC